MKISTFIWSLILPFCLLAQEKAAEGNVKEARMKAEMALIDGQKHFILENYVKALEMFQTARDIIPDDPAIHFKIAEVLYQEKEHNKAIVSANKALELDPTNKFYYVLAADIEIARGDVGSAQRLYEDLIKMPGNEDYLGELALVYEYQGKYKKSLETLGLLRDHFGTNEAIVLEFQKIYGFMKTPEKAVDEWKRLTEEYPYEDDYLVKYINQLIIFDRMDEAKNQLKEILNSDPENPQANLMLAEIFKNEGNSSDAIRLAEQSLLSPSVEVKLKAKILTDILNSGNADDHEGLASLTQRVAEIHPDDFIAQALAGDILFQLGNKRGSIVYYVKATSIEPENFSIWQNVLSMEAELGMWSELTKHSEQAMEYFPNQGAIYHFAGTGHLRQGQFQKAAQYLEMGKKYALNDQLMSAFEAQLGDAYKALKNYSKSDMAFENAIQLNPKNDHALNNYCYSLALRKVNLDRALTLSNELIRISPGNPNYLDTHGMVLFSNGNFKDARKALEKASENSRNPNILEHYGDVLFKLGQENDALIAWERSVEMGNKTELIYKKIADRKYYE